MIMPELCISVDTDSADAKKYYCRKPEERRVYSGRQQEGCGSVQHPHRRRVTQFSYYILSSLQWNPPKAKKSGQTS
jgi:hypothetical protein